MNDFRQGDIIKINGFKNLFVIVSKNLFIRTTGKFLVCPLLKGTKPGPLHIIVEGKKGEEGTVICEQIKYIDPDSRICNKKDWLSYDNIMDISDAIQGIFEYD